MIDWIDILPNPLPTQQAIQFVTDSRAGGIDIFLGTTRAERNADNRELIALDYEAYKEMATEKLRHLTKQAAERWPIVKVAILHRVGRVALGEPSVVIAVSTPHRADAFDACRFLIDELKKDGPIWKKEIWSDGGESWVSHDKVTR
jgi:molybdopterin synthase catalytic subunit